MATIVSGPAVAWLDLVLLSSLRDNQDHVEPLQSHRSEVKFPSRILRTHLSDMSSQLCF
jgi:hypothetical protein